MHTMIYNLVTIATGLVVIIFRKRIVDSVFTDDMPMRGTFWKHFMFGGDALQRKLNYWIFLVLGLVLVLSGVISLLGN